MANANYMQVHLWICEKQLQSNVECDAKETMEQEEGVALVVDRVSLALVDKAVNENRRGSCRVVCASWQRGTHCMRRLICDGGGAVDDEKAKVGAWRRRWSINRQQRFQQRVDVTHARQTELGEMRQRGPDERPVLRGRKGRSVMLVSREEHVGVESGQVEFSQLLKDDRIRKDKEEVGSHIDTKKFWQTSRCLQSQRHELHRTQIVKALPVRADGVEMRDGRRVHDRFMLWVPLTNRRIRACQREQMGQPSHNIEELSCEFVITNVRQQEPLESRARLSGQRSVSQFFEHLSS